MSFAIGVNQTEKKKRRTPLGTCQKLAGGEGGGVGILNLGSEIR